MTKKESEEVSAAIVECFPGVTCKCYHGGMGHAARKAVHLAFLQDQVQVVVATLAFGMGIDKPGEEVELSNRKRVQRQFYASHGLLLRQFMFCASQALAICLRFLKSQIHFFFLVPDSKHQNPKKSNTNKQTCDWWCIGVCPRPWRAITSKLEEQAETAKLRSVCCFGLATTALVS